MSNETIDTQVGDEQIEPEAKDDANADACGATDTACGGEACAFAEQDEDEEGDKDRPLPSLAPSTLLSSLSQLWTYPWKGLEPSRAVLKNLVSDETLASYRLPLGELQASLEEYAKDGEEIVGADAYQLEYTRLFIGSFKMYAPPYASFYVDGEEQVYGPSTVEIENLYAQFGIEIGENDHDMPDHLRFLLAFLALLAQSYEAKGASEFAYAYEDFKTDYIATWINDFAAKVNEFSEHPFFRKLIALTLQAI